MNIVEFLPATTLADDLKWLTEKETMQVVAGLQRRVVVGVGGGSLDAAVLDAAVAQARRLNAELVAVRAWIPDGGEFNCRQRPGSPLLESCRQRAGDVLTDAFLDAFGGRPAGVGLSFVIGRGEVGPVLVAVADRPDDLLVVGADRARSLAVLCRGSISGYCRDHAGCAVMVVGEHATNRRLRRRHHGLETSVPDHRVLRPLLVGGVKGPQRDAH